MADLTSELRRCSTAVGSTVNAAQKTIDVKHHGTAASSQVRRRHFSASYRRETEIPDVCCCLESIKYSGTKAHTARQVSRAQANGNQPTTASHRDVNDRNSGEIWSAAWFSQVNSAARNIHSAPSTKYETAAKSYVISRKTTHRVHGHDDGLIPRY